MTKTKSAWWKRIGAGVCMGIVGAACGSANDAGVSDEADLGSVSQAVGGGCADGTAEQSFNGGMVGCAGAVKWADRATLCAKGYHVANAREWRSGRGGASPTHHYWTQDDLHAVGMPGNCSYSYSSGSACPAGQPMHVCSTANMGVDPEGNRCAMVGCSADFFGGCTGPGNDTAGSLCVPNGCADGTQEQTFSRGMVGCAGSVTWASRATLCANGYRVARSEEWTQYRGTKAATHDYWTDDALRYTGSPVSCAVSTSGGTACPPGTPMHVCTATGTDAEGNTCTWENCGADWSMSSNEYFGGCAGSTAGAVCLPVGQGCADHTSEQAFNAFAAGCAGSVTWANRDSLCAAGWSPIPSGWWEAYRGDLVPTHDYWTNNDLRWSGTSSSCSASTETGNACPSGSPMRICTPSGTDAEGNKCTWTNCGLNAATPNDYIGGCQDPKAGTVCVNGP
jgi:hypothetical protein